LYKRSGNTDVTDQPAGLAALVLRQIAILLGELTEADLADLATGRKKLLISEALPGAVSAAIGTAPVGAPPDGARPSRPRGSTASPPSRGTATLDPDTVRPVLMAMPSRAEATRYILNLGSVPALRALADGFGVRLSSKDKKADVARKIVDGTVGLEFTAQAVRGMSD
jgi:hypothetical protein